MIRSFFSRWSLAILSFVAMTPFWSGAAFALTCADLAGHWTGPWTFIGPRASTPQSTLTVVVASDCTYTFSGQYWNGQIKTPGRFTISGDSLEYRNEAGSYGPVQYTKSGSVASLRFVQAQGNYTAIVARRNR